MNYQPALLGSTSHNGEYHFMGVNVIPHVFIGRIIGPFLKRKVLGEQPFAKNSFTDKSYIFPDNLRLIVRNENGVLGNRPLPITSLTQGKLRGSTFRFWFFCRLKDSKEGR